MITFHTRDLERAARSIGVAKDQVAFATSQALNDAAFKTRDHFINVTWQRHVQVRDRNFLRNALRVEKASKRSLRVAVTTEGTAAGNRGHLKLHDKGGSKPARGRLAIPSDEVKARRGAKGVPKNLRPANLKGSFRRGDAIYQTTGKGKRRKVRLMYTLKTVARIRPTVPFSEDFVSVFRREFRIAFQRRAKAAMRTRR